MKHIPTHCSRCGDRLYTSIMSKFNTDTICMACKEDERTLPFYPYACDAEHIAVLRGDYNFPGIGLSDTDQATLASLREARRQS